MRTVILVVILITAVLCFFDAVAATNSTKRTVASYAMSLALFILCALMSGGVL